MNAIANRFIIVFLSALFILSAAIAAWFQQAAWLLVPFGFLACIFLIQHPEYLLYVLLISIPWSFEYNFNEHLGTDLPDEPLMLMTALAGILLIILNADKIKKIIAHPLIILLCFQLAWTFFTVLLSTEPVYSIKYLAAKCWYLLAFVAVPAFLFRNQKIMKKSLLLFAGSMVAVMILSLIRHAAYGFTFEKVNKAIEPFFRNHVNYSSLLVCIVPILIACIQLLKPGSKKYVCVAILIVTIAAVIVSYARGAWLALIIGFAAYWLIRKKLLLFSFILFFMLCTGFVLYLKNNDRYLKFSNDFKTTIFHTDFRQHLIATYELKDVSTAERFYRWVAGINMIKDTWMTGFGPTTFYDHYKSYTIPAFKTWVSNNQEHSTIHNYFLLLLVEQGVPGLLLFLALLAAMLWYVQRLYHHTTDPFRKIVLAATAAVLMMVCTVNFLSDLIETDKIGSVFYLCLAVIVAAPSTPPALRRGRGT